MKALIYLLFAISLHGRRVESLPHPMSDEFIDLINQRQSTWIAGRNFEANTPYSAIKMLMGTNITHEKLLPVVRHEDLEQEIPEHFDSRLIWPKCPSLSEIRDQGGCGSCYALATVEVITDRICIHSKQKAHFHVSAEDLLTCGGSGSCQLGGIVDQSFEYYVKEGIVSGGNYNSNEGCKPYSIPKCNHHSEHSMYPPCKKMPTPNCVETCRPGYNISYKADRHKGVKSYSLECSERMIQLEIMKNGPVATGFNVYEDFPHYKSGVYRYTEGELLGGHAVKVFGWGEEKGVKYWLVANSWNEEWGDNGFFKMIRGENDCGFEANVVAAIPKI